MKKKTLLCRSCETKLSPIAAAVQAEREQLWREGLSTKDEEYFKRLQVALRKAKESYV